MNLSFSINLLVVLYVILIPVGLALIWVGIVGGTGMGIDEGKPAFWLLAIAGVAAILWGGARLIAEIIRWFS